MRVDPQEPPHAEEQSEQHVGNALGDPGSPCAQEPSDEEESLPESCGDGRFEPL